MITLKDIKAITDLVNRAAEQGYIAGLQWAADNCTSGPEGLALEEEIRDRISALQSNQG